MGKYDPISTFLSNQRKKKHILSFRQVEKLIGTQLPTSARKHAAWWSGNSATWVQAGWRAAPDLRKKKVTFLRDKQALKSSEIRATAPPRASVSYEAPPSGRRRVSKKVPATGSWGGHHFQLVSVIEPKRDGGKIILDRPHLRYSNQRGLALHSYGAGPFCKFSISDSYHQAGVYVLVVEGRVMYVGETEDLSRRYNTGYGTISPRNCYVGGQSTNCRINALILAATKSTAPVYLWFTPTAGYKQLEREMIQSLQPNWNRK